MDYVALGKLVRYRRKEMNLTQGELAEKAGVSASFMGHIERGTRVISLETFVALCNTLHFTPNEMLAAEVDVSSMPNQITISPNRLISGLTDLLLKAAVGSAEDDEEDEVDEDEETPCQPEA